jgi:hypothetical protein
VNEQIDGIQMSGRKFTRFRREYCLYLKFKPPGRNLVKENGIIKFGPAEPKTTAQYSPPGGPHPVHWLWQLRIAVTRSEAVPSPSRPTPTGQENASGLASLRE